MDNQEYSIKRDGIGRIVSVNDVPIDAFQNPKIRYIHGMQDAILACRVVKDQYRTKDATRVIDRMVWEIARDVIDALINHLEAGVCETYLHDLPARVVEDGEAE